MDFDLALDGAESDKISKNYKRVGAWPEGGWMESIMKFLDLCILNTKKKLYPLNKIKKILNSSKNMFMAEITYQEFLDG